MYEDSGPLQVPADPRIEVWSVYLCFIWASVQPLEYSRMLVLAGYQSGKFQLLIFQLRKTAPERVKESSKVS